MKKISLIHLMLCRKNTPKRINNAAVLASRNTRKKRKDEYVILHHKDIHFIDEDAEKEFYESLEERKEE